MTILRTHSSTATYVIGHIQGTLSLVSFKLILLPSLETHKSALQSALIQTSPFPEGKPKKNASRKVASQSTVIPARAERQALSTHCHASLTTCAIFLGMQEAKGKFHHQQHQNLDRVVSSKR